MTAFRRLLPFLFVPVLLVFSSSAFAEGSPWWHLSATAQPTSLKVARESPEVQDLTVSGTPGEAFVLAELTQKQARETVEGKREPRHFTVLEVGAEPSAIQAGLEEESLYGAGKVEVTGGPGARLGLEPYVITFKGALADHPLERVNTELGPLAGFKGIATVAQVSEGAFSGELLLSAVNRGDAIADGVSSPIVLTDRLPAGVNALAVSGVELGRAEPQPAGSCSLGSAQLVTCEFSEKVNPFDGVQARIVLGTPTERKPGERETNEATVFGGGAQEDANSGPVVFGGEPAFGVAEDELVAEEAGGDLDRQAGSHPFQLTSRLQLNQNLAAVPAALVKDLNFELPAGLIGNPTPFPKCTLAQFHSIDVSVEPETRCPTRSVVGVASVTVNRVESISGNFVYRVVVPVFSIETAFGEPARFGFFVPEGNVPVLLDTSVRAGGDYGVTVSVSNISQAVGFLSSEVTFWGVPGDPAHDTSRGLECIANPEDPACAISATELHPPPLLSLPTSCTGPLQSSVVADSWAQEGNFETFDAVPMPALGGCNRLPFSSTISATPNGHAASTPTGLKVDVHVPQAEALNAAGLEPSDVKSTTVVLPEGLALNPAAGDGLQACTEAEAGYQGENPETHAQRFTPAAASCPQASKIAKVTIKSPLLPAGQFVEGFVYLASPQNFSVLAGAPRENPFESLVAMYLIAEDPISGTLVKLPGRVSLGATGQVTTTFESPQLPFEDAEFEFFSGERAPLATPAHCGTYTTNASFAPWSGDEPIGSTGSFEITGGPNGQACPGAVLPFTPSLSGETTNINAGAFTPLLTTISREDGNQDIRQVTLKMPSGLSGILTGVPLCPEAQANAGTCSQASRIGSTIVSVGLGGDPYTVTGGEVFLAEKIAGSPADAPFGLSIVNPAVAGPFNLGKVIVRATIEVDPHTAALTIATGSGVGGIPNILDGIPLQIKHVNVTIERNNFTFNPTNCNPSAITGDVGSTEGASSSVSVPFQVTNCAVLKFAPKFAVTTSGKTSKAKGASLHVKLTYPQGPLGTYANIARVKVDLPKQLPSQLKTLQKACTAAQFEANPAGCPVASKVGYAKAVTPLIPVPLEGPAIFVSHGNEAFPSLIIVLQGYGVTLDLVGSTLIKHGITSSTFKTVPDAPVGSFELTLPQGKYSALAANANLCKAKLAMPTEFLAQNGAKINESTKIAVTGCPKAVRHERKKTHKKKKKK